MIIYKLEEDGGFRCGDTESNLTSYAYPSSLDAKQAKKNPVKVSARMIANEGVMRGDGSYDKRNWERLGI